MSFSYKIIDELCSGEIINKNFCIGEFFALDSYLKKYDSCLKKKILADKRDFFKKKLLAHNINLNGLNFNLIKQSNNSRRGFLAGMFICCGILSDPKKSYNLEFINNNFADAELIKKNFAVFNMNVSIARRKNDFVNYIHDSEMISKFLKLIKVSACLMEFENIRILKELRSDINRTVNCETANLNKMIKASCDAVNDIKYIIEKVGLNYLPEDLQMIAFYRLKYRHATLKELGEKFCPILSKSSVHYKLKNIKMIAQELRKNKKKEK